VSASPQGRGWGHTLVGIVLETIIFVAIGPLVGTLIVLAILTAIGGVGVVFLVVGGFPPILLFGYPIIWKAAAVTGIVVAAARLYVDGLRQLYWFAAMVGALASIVSETWRHGNPSSLAYAIMIGGAGAGAALLCTWLGGRLRRSADARSGAV
jgi:hypothetical protein